MSQACSALQVPGPAAAGADGSPSSEVHSVSTVDTFAAVGSAEVAQGHAEALAGAVPFVPVTVQVPHQPAVLQVGAFRLAAASAASCGAYPAKDGSSSSAGIIRAPQQESSFTYACIASGWQDHSPSLTLQQPLQSESHSSACVHDAGAASTTPAAASGGRRV